MKGQGGIDGTAAKVHSWDEVFDRPHGSWWDSMEAPRGGRHCAVVVVQGETVAMWIRNTDASGGTEGRKQ